MEERGRELRPKGTRSPSTSRSRSRSRRKPDLYSLAAANDIAGLRARLDGGATAQQRDAQGRSALDAAATFGRAEVLRVLVEAGASINEQDRHGYSPLHRAAAWGRTELVAQLVAGGADIQCRTGCDETALAIARRYSMAEAAALLEQAEAELPPGSQQGDAPPAK